MTASLAAVQRGLRHYELIIKASFLVIVAIVANDECYTISRPPDYVSRY